MIGDYVRENEYIGRFGGIGGMILRIVVGI